MKIEYISDDYFFDEAVVRVIRIDGKYYWQSYSCTAFGDVWNPSVDKIDKDIYFDTEEQAVKDAEGFYANEKLWLIKEFLR